MELESPSPATMHVETENCTPTPRPTVPPKPKTKEVGKVSTKSTVGTQVHFVPKTSPGRNRPVQGASPNLSSPITRNGSGNVEGDALSPNNVAVVEVFKGSTSPGTEKSRSLSLSSALKPALPPKPTSSALLSPRKATSLSLSPNTKLEKSPTQIRPQLSKDSHLFSPSQQPFAKLEFEEIDLTNSNNPARVSHEAFQPVTNLNQSQKSSSNRLTQSRTVQPLFSHLTEIQKLEARKKTTSLGRNFDFSTTSAIGRNTNTTQQFFKASPLDLSSSIRSRPRSMDHFGRTVSFAPNNSCIPPPPPPRIKRKFSSTSPGTALLPESPPSPRIHPVYAQVDKDKKWEMRRLKQEIDAVDTNIVQPDVKQISTTTKEIDATLILGSKPEEIEADVLINNCANSSHDQVCEPDEETPAINSWLGKVLAKSEDSLDSATKVDKNQQNSELITTEQIQSIIGHCVQIENRIEKEDEEELTPTEESLPENKSFLFLQFKKEEKNVPSAQVLNTPDDSFEKICDIKLESLSAPLNEINGNAKESYSRPESLSICGQYPSESDQQVFDEAGKLLESVDSKILNLRSLLSTISNSPTETLGVEGNMEIEVGRLSTENLDKHSQSSSNEYFGSSTEVTGGSEGSTTEIELASGIRTDADLVNAIVSQKFPSHSRREESPGLTKTEVVKTITPTPAASSGPVLSRDSFRRRSWTCSDHTSSGTSESSHSSSSSSIRDRAGSMTRATGWLDAGELSNGALGDAENSDAPSQAIGEDSFRPYPGSGGSLSRRKRTTVKSIFSSFGKSMGSSSGSNSPANSTKPKRNEKAKPFLIDHRSSPKKGHPHRVIGKSEIVVSPMASQLSHWSPGASGSPQGVPAPSQKTVSIQFGHSISQELYHSGHSTSSLASQGQPSGNHPGILDDEEGEKAEGASIIGNNSVYDDILADLSPKEKKAFYVARELLTSERTFVDVLNLLTIDFPQALKEAAEINRHPIISDSDLQIILGELPSLKKVNIILLGELEERIPLWKSNPKVADIIVKTGPFLKHYSAYIKEFERISRYFGECRQRNPKFSKIVMDFEGSERCQKLCLMHYMLKPVQRMPLYPLLLEDYLKNLEPESADFEDTMKAITIVREVAEHANDAIRLQANADKLIQLQNRLNHSVILKPDRQMIKEGELQKVCRKELQPRYFALMNDCLLCLMYNASTGSNRDLKLRYELPLTGMQISLSSSEDYPNEFTVISTARSFNLLAKSAKEREEWMKALNLAIRDNIKKRSCSTPEMDKEFELGKVAPVWVQDKRSSMCQVCTAEFTITFRRHHCRACGKVVCGSCSRNEAPLQYQNLESARVCDDCYQFLMEEFDRAYQQNHSVEVEAIRVRFKKATLKVAGPPRRRTIPTRLEINPNIGAQASGYLNWRERKSWKRRWFVLSDRVLLVCAASEDKVASKSISILGYDVEIGTEKTYDGIDGQLVFKLTHSGQNPMIFQAENASSLEKWVTAVKEATILT